MPRVRRDPSQLMTADVVSVEDPLANPRTHRRRHPPWIAYAFLAPNILGVLAFTLVPLVGGVLISFTKWDVVSGLQGIRWVGLANFANLLHDASFGHALVRTLLFVLITVPVTVLLGLALAIALNQPIPGQGALRAIFFLPYVVNIIAIGTVWLIMYNPQSGLINRTLRAFGISSPPGWLIDQWWALPSLMLISIWAGIGYVAVIYLAALQDMPIDLHEAAMVDGAGIWTRFRTITWPALLPTTMFLVITNMISSSQGFGMIAFLTQGGPGSASTTASYYMYQNGFMYYRFGYAAAVGFTMFLGVFVFTSILWRWQRDRGLYA